MNNSSFARMSFFEHPTPAPTGATPRMVTKPSRDVSLAEVYNYIVGDAAREATRCIREASDSSVRSFLKRTSLSYVTPFGTFSYRNNESLTAESGFVCIDFDHVGSADSVRALRNAIIDDPRYRTALLFVSPSGDGLKWFIDAGDRNGLSLRTYIDNVALHAAAAYGVSIDLSGKDVSRACFLPHDPECFIRPEYVVDAKNRGFIAEN